MELIKQMMKEAFTARMRVRAWRVRRDEASEETETIYARSPEDAATVFRKLRGLRGRVLVKEHVGTVEVVSEDPNQ